MSNGSAVRFRTASLGYPVIGPARELKWALENYWRGEITGDALQQQAAQIRADNWRTQQAAGIDDIPCGDFSLYDRMLDLAFALGCIPARFSQLDPAALSTYFATARGSADARALDMTKWFDTNYHYVQPEIGGTPLRMRANPYLATYHEALALKIRTRPVLIGPLTFLALSAYESGHETEILASLVPAYCALLSGLAAAGVTRVQIDEPIFATDLAPVLHEAAPAVYRAIRGTMPDAHITLATYFGGFGPALQTVCTLPIDAIHFDCTRAPDELDAVVQTLPQHFELSLGCIDGRNIWRANDARVTSWIDHAVRRIGVERLTLATSCSLAHVPVDLANETQLAAGIRERLSFAKQKLDELRNFANMATTFAKANVHPNDTLPRLATSASAAAATASATLARNPAFVTNADGAGTAIAESRDALIADHRRSPRPERVRRQNEALGLPELPTTTIGSLPQTADVRRMRSRLRRGEITNSEYEIFVRAAITDAIQRQEAAGIDVLVHGEFERNDMVEFFGERLHGFAVSENGWVVSYGSRCVKPPILFGDVARDAPMTVGLAAFAQSCTDKPVKGMLTGPITILQWSFVRDDQPRSVTAFNVAAALAAEVADLTAAGIRIVQIDEPGLREGLPLRASDHARYLQWATHAFRASSAGAGDDIQIHTHMCYADFTDILGAVADLDADVVTFEAARSGLQLLPHLQRAAPQYDVGPGVFDIHSPVVETVASMEDRIRSIISDIDARQVWINPDCGLKTRTWDEVSRSLANMCDAALNIRKELSLRITHASPEAAIVRH